MDSCTTLLVVISGPPASGKTTLARVLSARYNLPLFTKDDFKEMMFDNALPTNPAELRFYGQCSIHSLQIVTRQLLAHKISHIIEANFDSALFSPFIRCVEANYAFRCLQIQMTCSPDVLEKRFAERAGSAERHPGHTVPNVHTVHAIKSSITIDTSSNAVGHHKQYFRQLSDVFPVQDALNTMEFS